MFKLQDQYRLALSNKLTEDIKLREFNEKMDPKVELENIDKVMKKLEKEMMSLEVSSTNRKSNTSTNSASNHFNKYGFETKENSDEEDSLDDFSLRNSNSSKFYTNPDAVSLKSTKSSKSIFSIFKSKSNLKTSNMYKSTSSLFGDSLLTDEISLKESIEPKNLHLFAENLPMNIIRQRETKWMDMLTNLEKFTLKHPDKLKLRCRKGIPRSMRAKAWMVLSGAEKFKQKIEATRNENSTYYQECLNKSHEKIITSCIEDIKKDLHRQFPSHELFMESKGQESLGKVLKAYAAHNPAVGYCQAQGPLAAVLLMHMPEEDSFYMLIQISDFILKGYYNPGLAELHKDAQVLLSLFEKENKFVHDSLVSNNVIPVFFMTDWFMCVFVRTLPWCTVLRIWDMFFCEGPVVMFRVGLYLMKTALGNKKRFKEAEKQGDYEILNLLKIYPVDALREANLVKMSSLFKFDQNDVNNLKKKI